MLFASKTVLNGLVLAILGLLPVVGVRILSPEPSAWPQLLITIAAVAFALAVVERAARGLGGLVPHPLARMAERLLERERVGSALVVYFGGEFFRLAVAVAVSWIVVALISTPLGLGIQLLGPWSVVVAASVGAFIRLAAREAADIPSADTTFHLFRQLGDEAQQATESSRAGADAAGKELAAVDAAPERSPLPLRLVSRVRAGWSMGVANKMASKGDFDGALTKYQVAVEAARHDPNALMITRSLLAEFLIEHDRDAEAIPFLRSIVDDAHRSKRYWFGMEGIVASELRLEGLKTLGDTHQRLGDQAAEYKVRLEQADAALADSDVDAYIEALLKAATAQVARGLVVEGAAIYERVLDEASSRAAPRARAFALVPLAHLQFHLGYTQASWQLAREALELRDRTGEAGLIAEAHWLLAFLHLRGGAVEEAREELGRAISAAETAADDAAQVERYRRELAGIPGPFGDARWQVST